MIKSIIIIIIYYLIIRKIAYDKLLQYKSINSFNGEINHDIDNITSFDNMNINNTIESDYSKINLSMVDSYNICYLREYLHSDPTDATIQLAEISDNMKILDMGAGTGMVAIYICKKFKNIQIDCVINTKNLYDKIIENITKNKLVDRIKVYLMDFNKEIPNNNYDRILFLESIGYAHNRLELLNNSVKLLKENGKLFIKTPSIDNCIPDKYYKDISKLFNKWKCNFSSTNSLINDVKQIPNTNSKYISFKLCYSNIFYNFTDIIKIILFCIINKINVIEDMFIGYYINEDFVLIEKI